MGNLDVAVRHERAIIVNKHIKISLYVDEAA